MGPLNREERPGVEGGVDEGTRNMAAGAGAGAVKATTELDSAAS